MKLPGTSHTTHVTAVPHLRETRGLTRAKFAPKYNFPIKRPFILRISLLNAYLFYRALKAATNLSG